MVDVCQVMLFFWWCFFCTWSPFFCQFEQFRVLEWFLNRGPEESKKIEPWRKGRKREGHINDRENQIKCGLLRIKLKSLYSTPFLSYFLTPPDSPTVPNSIVYRPRFELIVKILIRYCIVYIIFVYKIVYKSKLFIIQCILNWYLTFPGA